ncbi:MAG: carboxymuconolactone decarboxylase family protein [Anaerolineae bacterium]
MERGSTLVYHGRMVPSSRNAYTKRFYRPGAFVRALAGVLWHFPALVRAVRGVRVSRQFGEEIMLAVTQVNGCRYCSYVHSRMALRAGVTADEMERLLALEIGTFPEGQSVALAFAQHYAESDGKPDAEALARLESYYGAKMARDIIAYIRVITFANLSGTTVDAFLSRLRGRPAADSSFLGELILFLPLFPFVLPLLGRVEGEPTPAQAGRGTSPAP